MFILIFFENHVHIYIILIFDSIIKYLKIKGGNVSWDAFLRD